MKKLSVLIFIIGLSTVCVVAQPDTLVIEKKLTKNERILALAHNDTTRLLAQLFIAKRNRHAHRAKEFLNALVITTSVSVVGGFMLASDELGGASALGVVPLLAGSITTVFFVGGLGVLAIINNPFTLKKFNKLINLLRQGQPLPEFYKAQLQGHFY
jgi:hypothetical protein